MWRPGPLCDVWDLSCPSDQFILESHENSKLPTDRADENGISYGSSSEI